MEEDYDLIKEARKRVKAKKGFYWHLAIYAIMGVFFFLVGGTDAMMAMIPWGVGLAIHMIAVFGIPGVNVLGKDWEREQLEREIADLRAEKQMRNEMLLLSEEDDMMNINEKDYIKIREMKRRR